LSFDSTLAPESDSDTAGVAGADGAAAGVGSFDAVAAFGFDGISNPRSMPSSPTPDGSPSAPA